MRAPPSSSAPALAALATLVTAASLAMSAVGCVDDGKVPSPPAFDVDASIPPIQGADAAPPSLDAAPPLPPVDAGPDGASFATGLGAGAVVTKSAKYTLITKTGGSPGGHGIAKSPSNVVVSGAAASSKK